METLTITLPAELREFATQEAARRGMTSPGEFIQELLDIQLRSAESQTSLEAKLLEGHGGATTTFTNDWWQRRQQEIKSQVGTGK